MTDEKSKCVMDSCDEAKLEDSEYCEGHVDMEAEETLAEADRGDKKQHPHD